MIYLIFCWLLLLGNIASLLVMALVLTGFGRPIIIPIMLLNITAIFLLWGCAM